MRPPRALPAGRIVRLGATADFHHGLLVVLQAVTLREINRIFEVTDRLGIHREMIVIPLSPRHPGRVRRTPNGKLEIVVESEGSFDEWVSGLEASIQTAG